MVPGLSRGWLGPYGWDPMAWDPMAWDPMAWDPMAWDPMALELFGVHAGYHLMSASFRCLILFQGQGRYLSAPPPAKKSSLYSWGTGPSTGGRGEGSEPQVLLE